MSKRVPPPPPGARKGPPPPANRNIIKPLQQIESKSIQTIQKPQISINTPTKQTLKNVDPTQTQQLKQVKQKVPISSTILKNKPPIQNKRTSNNVPNIPQKIKTVPTATLYNPTITKQIKTQEPKIVEPVSQSKQISQSFTQSKKDSRKDNQIDSIKSKLDDVLNARSLLLDNSESCSQEQQQLQNNNILVDQLTQQQPNVDSNSDKFEELKQQQSNESSVKQIKQDLLVSEVLIEKPFQSERIQSIKQDYEVIEPIQNQSQSQSEKISYEKEVPVFTNQVIIKPQIKHVPVSQEQIIQKKNCMSQSQLIRSVLTKLRQKQRKMNQNLLNTSQTFLQKQQNYLNKIDQLKRKLVQKQQIITRLKSN